MHRHGGETASIPDSRLWPRVLAPALFLLLCNFGKLAGRTL